jgi:2-octaprenyl-6-methoxyphenol hydroxylase
MSAVPVSSDATAVDVAIVGGGMVGASLALGLAGSGMRILLTEAVPFGASGQPSFDERSTALGNASRRIFEGLGVWREMAPEAAPIRAIHISDAGGFGCARLRAAEQGVEALGYVVPNRRIGAALWGLLSRAPGLTLRVPGRIEDIAIDASGARFNVVSEGAREAVTARLIVAADGAHSEVRTAAGIETGVEDYEQVAVVANVESDTPHEGIAYERFTRSGPLAVLPLADATLSVIWACHRADAPRVLALDDPAWLRELQSRFGWRAGHFVRAGRRASYPLRLTRALSPVATRTVLIGNAAQALHPVAGQGFNLGLRDAAMLAEVLTGSAGDPGDAALLERFAAWRAHDRSGVTRFTDGLVRLFGDRRPGMGLVRNLGLLLFDLSPPAKSALARVSLGFGGPTPRLARGLPVRHG